MKLTAMQIAIIERETEAKAIPEDDEVATSLTGQFGDHTFYLDPNGLYVFERSNAEKQGREPVALVKIAEWVDESRTSISPIEPEVKPVIVDLAQ